nr:histidine kinase [Luteibacter sp. Sphag1AF]
MTDNRRNWLWSAVAFVACALAQLLSAAIWSHQGGAHTAWFPGAVLLALLLSTGRAAWPGCVAGAFLGIIALGLIFGLPALSVALVIAPPLLLCPVAAHVLLQMPGNGAPMEDFRRLFAFVLVALVALPLVSAQATYYMSQFTPLRGDVLSDWPNIALAHSLGYVLYVPVWVSVATARQSRAGMPSPKVAQVVSLVAATALLAILWYHYGDEPSLRPLLLVAPAPLILAASSVGRMPGTAICIAVVAVIAAQISVMGKGPFLASTPPLTTLAVQLWSLAMAVGSLGLGLLIEQRVVIRQDLAATNREVRELAGRLIATQEQERARLARDLHDDVNQRLAAVSIQLSALRRRVAIPEQSSVARIQGALMELSNDVRHLSHELHPSMLRQTGLAGALDALCNSQRHHKGPSIQLEVEGKANDLPADISLCFYRVVQEALANAIRHAFARRVYVAVTVDSVKATLFVSDDGVGFLSHVPEDGGKRGIGLISMGERAKLLGGSFELRTSPGKGVDVCIRIPLPT